MYAAARRGDRELAEEKDHCRIYVDDSDCPTRAVELSVAASSLRYDDDDNMRKIGP